VAGLVALEGDEVTAQLNVTVPVNELAGVTVTVEVLLVAPPGVVEMLPLLESVKLPLLPPGACQKSPQPVRPTAMQPRRNGAASVAFIHFPMFIAAP
jgi:hypothetical protein